MCGPWPLSLIKGESELSEDIKGRRHGNRDGAHEGHKMECAFSSGRGPVMYDT